ncbi:MAG: hypothetical protein Q8P03_02135 [bacterium]|nr:hypothetical protein [bacterium]
MGTEAWVKRDGERQGLLQELVRRVYAREDELKVHEVARFRFGLLFVLLANLRTIRTGSPFSVLGHHNFVLETVFFGEEIMPRVKEFSRAEEETQALLASFFSQLFESEKIHFQSKLSRLEIADPRMIFHAPSAMAEVEL